MFTGLAFALAFALQGVTATTSAACEPSEYTHESGNKFQIQCGQEIVGEIIPRSEYRFGRHSRNIPRATVTTVGDCIDDCLAISGCLAASYTDNECTLYSTVAGVKSMPGAQSAFQYFYSAEVTGLISAAESSSSTTSKKTTTTSKKSSTTSSKASTTSSKKTSTTTPKSSTTSSKKTSSTTKPASTTSKKVSTTTSKKTSSTPKTTTSSTASSLKLANKAVSTSSKTSSKASSTTKKTSSTTKKSTTSSKKATTTSSKKTTTSSKKTTTTPKTTTKATTTSKKVSTTPKTTTKASTTSKKVTTTTPKSSAKATSTTKRVSTTPKSSTLTKTTTKSSSKTTTPVKTSSTTAKSSTTSHTSSKTSSSSHTTSKATTLSTTKSSTTSSKASTTTLSTTKSSTTSSKASTTSSKATTSSKSSTTSSKASTTSSKSSTTSKASTTSKSTTTSSTSSATPTPTVNSGKRGLAYNDVTLTNPFSLSGQNSQVSWAYNWYLYECGYETDSCDQNPAIEYIPLLFNNDSSVTDLWPTAAQFAIDNGATALMSFNEPDLCVSGSACMTVNSSVEAYKKYMQPFAGKAMLGAPAVTNGGAPYGLTWLSEFMGNCTDCQIDFINLHWYSNKYAGATYFENYINGARELADGRPIWITEFGLTDDYTQDDLDAFLETVLPWMDQQSDIARYAYFYDAPGYLINSNGTGLSETGVLYNNYTNTAVQPYIGG